MPTSADTYREQLLQAEVDQAVAPYVGRVPPPMLAKLRELAERYWRTHPKAIYTLNALAEKAPDRSAPDVQAKAQAPARATRRKREAN